MIFEYLVTKLPDCAFYVTGFTEVVILVCVNGCDEFKESVSVSGLNDNIWQC